MRRLYFSLIDRWWWLVALLLFGLAGAGVWQCTRLGIEFQTKTLLDEKDPELASYQELHETGTWGETEFAVVCVSGLDWVTEEGIGTLREFIADVEASPEVGGTMSVLDIPLLRQNPGQKPNIFALTAGFQTLRETEAPNWAAARTELLEHELAAGTLVSRDGRHANVLVYLNPTGAADAQGRWQRLVEGIRDVQAKWSPRLPEKVRLAGVPVVYTYIIERVAHDLRVFGIAAAVLFSAGLFLVFRKLRFVVLPLVASVVPVVLVLGVMGLLGMKFTVITSNLPLLLFVMTLPYTIYFVERYREHRAEAPDDSQPASLAAAGASLAMPCLFSALTTMAGFAAFATSGIVPVRQFGQMMALGAGLALVVALVAFPALQRPLRPVRVAPAERLPRRALARWFAALATSRPGAVAAASGVLLVLAIAGSFKLTAENKFTGYFWPSSDVYQGLEFIDQNLGGTSTLEVYLSSQQEGYFKTAEGVAAVAAVEKYFAGVPETGSIRSLPALVREARKTFRAEWFPTLTDEALLTLLQSAGPQLFQDIMNRTGTEASLQVRLKETSPTLNRRRILDGLNAHLRQLETKELAGLAIDTTGIFVLYANMLESLIVSQRDTLGVVVAAIYVMLLVLFRGFRLALVVLLPQALPAVTILGVMGWFGIPLDLVTVMISAIALGVGVDSAIQYTMRFREEFAKDGDLRAAVERSHATVGRAIWIATTVIVAGFGVLVFSDFFPSVWFGLFTGLAMLMSQFSALLTLPALFLLVGGRWRLFRTA